MRNLSERGALSQDRFPAAAGSETLSVSSIFSRFNDSASSPEVNVGGPKVGVLGASF